MLKKLMLVLIISVMVLFVLAGCTDNGLNTQTEKASANEGYDVGKVLPDFSVPAVGGGTFTLLEHAGKVVFINLFATWCPPCVGEMPDIDSLYSDYKDEVDFVAIDIGEDEATARAFAEDNGYALPFAYSVDGAPFTDYEISFIPQTFVLKPDGTIYQYFSGSGEREDFISAIDGALGK